MRNVARTVVALLLLTSAASFLSYAGIHASLNDPDVFRRLRQVAAAAHLIPYADAGSLGSARAMQRQASFVLQLGAATALLATVSLVVMAVAERRARGDQYGEEDENADVDLGACPECYEPIKGIEAICRECGHRFGPGSWPRRES